ncbi:hypothetical protein BH18ACI1_BH18ACI1_04610 [soil metagenome]
MNIKYYFKNFTILTTVLFLCAGFSFAQTAKFAAPRQEKLLNGLKLLTWTEPNAEKVTVKLRIHSGSAFDPQAKEGTMALLGDSLFPDETVKGFFRDELSGELDVKSNFDYIQINATANSDKILDVLETLANAVSNLQINKEITAKVRSARLEKVKELEKDPSYIADLAVAKRLYGDFPYGRAQMGTSESLQKIDFADLIFARQRFLTPDNATLTVVGNVKPDFVYRAVRRYFGAWEKADKKVPATFRQPDAPLSEKQLIELPNIEKVEIYQASRYMARNNKDYQAGLILASILFERLKNSAADVQISDLDFQTNIFVRNETHLLDGSFVIEIKLPADKATAFIEKIRQPFLLRKISDAEFEKSKTSRISEMNQSLSEKTTLAELWLNADTYQLISVKDEISKLNSVTLADVQRVAENLQKQTVVSVVVKKSEETKK